MAVFPLNDIFFETLCTEVKHWIQYITEGKSWDSNCNKEVPHQPGKLGPWKVKDYCQKIFTGILVTGGQALDNSLSVELIRKDGSTCTMPDMLLPGIDIHLILMG